jgi:hypothetical protein
LYAAQAIPPIDAEIAKKGHFWMETIYILSKYRRRSQSVTALSNAACSIS